MAKVHRVDSTHVAIHCPGCEISHVIDQRWKFNGSNDTPTFKPSLHCKGGHYVTGQSAAECNICREEGANSMCFVCHSHITDGRIQFLSDSTHALAGQTVDLPEWRGFDPDNYGAKS